MPDRRDRSQPLIHAAVATNINVTVLNAVRDKEIPEETWPESWNAGSHQVGELGCLVSHVRTWNKIISHNINTALILESDADWDLRLRSQLAQLPPAIDAIVDFPFSIPSLRSSKPSDKLLDNPSSVTHVEPYGLNWDIIWMGHCGSNAEGQARIYSYNDTTAPQAEKEFFFDVGLFGDQHKYGTRGVFQFARTTCSTGYAISNRGAHKLVKYFQETNENLDIELSRACSSHADMTCLGVWPQFFTNAPSASSIDHSGQGDTAPGSTDGEGTQYKPGPALQFSARVNAFGIMDDGWGPEDWIPEWDTMWGDDNGTWAMLPLNKTYLIERGEMTI